MKRILSIVVLAGALLAAVPLPVGATIRHTAKVKFVSPPRAAVSGQPYRGIVEIHGARDGEVSNLRLAGDGWSVNDLVATMPDGSSGTRIGRGRPMRVSFEATPSDAGKRLAVEFELDGKPMRKTFDLSPEAIAKVGKPGAMVPMRATTGSPAPDASVRPGFPDRDPGAAPPRPRAKRAGATTEAESEPQPTTASDRNIHLYGRIVYSLPNGTVMGAGRTTITVYDYDDDWDDEMGVVKTDWNGYFDITVSTDGTGEDEPDIYLEIAAANGRFVVQHDSVLEEDYLWETSRHWDFGGSSIDFGWIHPNTDGGALHILNTASRAWRWTLNTWDTDLELVDIQWPEDEDGASYDPYWEEIHIGPDRTWLDATISHEYGHHWINNYAVNQEPDYCNSTCDDSSVDCGHCMWCEETSHDAWNEGFPNWYCNLVTLSFAGDYGTPATNTRPAENLGICGGVGTGIDDPNKTEGVLAALLEDIVDSTQDVDALTTGGLDALDLTSRNIADLVKATDPLNPADFIAKFRAAYPQLNEALWKTAKNNGYEIDATPPGAVTNLTCTSHTVGSTYGSPDHSIDFTWTRAGDDASGVVGYSISLSSAPEMPNSGIQTLQNVTSYSTQNLADGQWYFNIRARDATGKWSATYASIGPIKLRPPFPADITPGIRAGWDAAFLPANHSGSTIDDVDAPTYLTGNAFHTWYNVNVINQGESTAPSPYYVQFELDGQHAGSYMTLGLQAPGEDKPRVNFPGYVRGGRHTFGVFVESQEQISEWVEGNNRKAKQWVWSPLTLNAPTPVTRVAPPLRKGGHAYLPLQIPSTYPDNCDGLRMTPPIVPVIDPPPPVWRSTAIHAVDVADDFDAYVDYPSSGAEEGFGGGLATSSRGPGETDAVLVNDHYSGSDTWDVGVVNQNDGDSTYVADYDMSTLLALGDSVGVTLAQDEMVALYQMRVLMLQTGPVTVSVLADPASGPVRVAWFRPNRPWATLETADASGVTGVSGRARIDVDADVSGYYAIAVFRDPKHGTGPVSFGLEIERTPANLVEWRPVSWPAPFVPLPRLGGGIAPPASGLPGDSATFLNFALRNDGATSAPGVDVRFFLDGATLADYAQGAIVAGDSVTVQWNQPHAVPGGRHMLSMRIDPDDDLAESNESDNGHREQFVWIPATVPMATPVTRPVPGAPNGGWGATEPVAAGAKLSTPLAAHRRSGLFHDTPSLGDPVFEPLWANCDGLRTTAEWPLRGSMWAGMAVMPGASQNVDLNLHELASGAKSGFDTSLVQSSWGPEQSEFVLVDFSRTSPRAFDLGVVNEAANDSTGQIDPGDYTAEIVAGESRGANPTGPIGSFTLGSGHILQLHQFHLDGGRHRFDLSEVGGGVDWGMSLYPIDRPFHGKLGWLPGAASFLAGPGVGESLSATILEPGEYCLAVWKVGTGDLGASGTYQLAAAWEVAGVDDGPTSATVMGAIAPNPFRGTTRVSFDLAREQEVRVEVYDVRGARLRTLAGGLWKAGRHSVEWDARRDGGERVAPGIYMVRMQAGAYQGVRKVVVSQ